MPPHALPLCVLLACLASACGDPADPAPQRLRPAAQGIDEAGHMHPSAEDRCPVCAMTTHDRKMVSAIALEDGATFYFCGPGCMLHSWLRPDHFLAANGRRAVRARTVDYFTGEHVDASAVHWVAGADVSGPMGKMIVPLSGDAALTKFKQRHGGTIEFRLEQLDVALWQRIRGQRAKADGAR